MSSTINTGSLPQFTDLVKRSFNDGLETLPQIMRNSGIVVEGTLPQHTGEYKRYAERLQRNQYGYVRPEGDVSQQAKVQYGYEKDMSVYTVSLGISITKRMRVAGKDQDIIDKVTNLSEVCPSTIDLDLAHRFTFAWSTSFTDNNGNSVDVTVGDWLALISTVHTLTGSATTYSNQIPNNPQFSKGALENADKLFVTNTYNNLGEKMMMKGDVVLTTDDPTTIHQVRELFHSESNVDTNNSTTFNVYKNAYTHVISGRIATDAFGATDTTKAKYRFLCSMMASDFYLDFLEQPYLKTPTDGNNGEDFYSENWNYLAAATYGIAIVTGRWVKGSKGDGTP